MATPKDRANDSARMPKLATPEEEQIRNYRMGDGAFAKKVEYDAGNPFHQKIVSDAQKGIKTGFPLRNAPKEPSTRKQETEPRNREYVTKDTGKSAAEKPAFSSSNAKRDWYIKNGLTPPE